MKHITLLAVALCAGLAGAVLADDLHGAWTANSDRERPGLYLGITRNRWSHYGDTLKIADFAGLTPAQVDSDTAVPVKFQLARESGTITFEGTFKRGDGAGQYSFQPNRAYIDSLRILGVAFEMHRHHFDKSEEDALFSLTMLDVSTSFIRTMQSMGYRETLDTYIEMRLFGVSQQFIQDLKDAGYANVPAKKLVALKVHGIDLNFIRAMNAIE